MVNFLKIGNIKLAMTEEETAKFNELKGVIDEYSDTPMWNKLWGTLAGAVGGTFGGYSGAKAYNKIASKININRFNNALNNSPAYMDLTNLDRARRGSIFTPDTSVKPSLHINMQKFNTLANVSPSLIALFSGGAAAISGYMYGANSESTNMATDKVVNSTSEMINLISTVLVRNGNSVGDPNVFVQELVDKGITIDADAIAKLVDNNNVGQLSIEQSSMDYTNALLLQNNSLKSNGYEIVDTNQPAITSNNDNNVVDTNTTPATPEEQSAWERFLDEHPSIKNYINNVKSMDPYTISATVAGTVLIGFGLYKAAKLWKSYRENKRKLKDINE